MTKITPFAVENYPLLGALKTPWESKAELAEHLGRDPSNLSKTLKRLAEEGYVEGTNLTEQGDDFLVGYNALVWGIPAAGAAPTVTHAQIQPDTLNPRKFTAEDEEGIAELAESIARDDLLENLVIRPAGADGVHRLVAGERRWRAIAKLIEDGRWARAQACPGQDHRHR